MTRKKLKRGNKRTPDQIQHDRKLVSELMLKGYTRQQMQDIICEERPYSISLSQIGYDIDQVRKAWLESQEINYTAILNRELARIEVFEAELWQHLRRSSSPKFVREVTRKLAQADSGEITDKEMKTYISRVVEREEARLVDPRYFDLILKTHQERRKLIGIYAPERRDVRQIISIKGYKDVSPSDWDDIIEGEVEQQPRLEDGKR